MVDASLAVKLVLLDEERVREAQALLAKTLDAAETMVTPPLLLFEVTNVIRQRVRRGGLEPDRALEILDQFLALPVTLLSPPGMHRRALALALELNLPAAYDAHYLALAEFAGCDLWSDDRRLLRQVGGRFPALRWIGDYRP